MGVMRYIIKLLDVPKPNIDFITSDPDSLGLIPTILKEALAVYLIYAVKEYDNNEEKPFLTFSK